MVVALLDEQMNQTRGSRNQLLQLQLAKSTRDPRHCRNRLCQARPWWRLDSSPKIYSLVFSPRNNTLQMAKSFIWKSIKIMSDPSPVVEGVFGTSCPTISLSQTHH